VEHFLGDSIVENDYVEASMDILNSEYSQTEVDMKIRVRGNTSCVFSEKKPYKIKLSKSMDLLGNGRKHKEYILLNTGADLKTYIATYISNLCGMEWQPDMMFVNVMMNGDWLGTYCLIEPVNRETAGEYVSDTGYIFENDAYWWNADGLYFRLNEQYPDFAYTFKYPDISSAEDEKVITIKDYMQRFEDCLLSGDEKYRDYIDEDTFAAWLLVRDVMGCFDGAGANMYFYKYDSSDESVVKMGPLWDFDSSFQTPDAWSTVKNYVIFYYVQLQEQDSFNESYIRQWQDLSENLVENIADYLQELEDDYGEALDESWKLNAERWSNGYSSFEDLKSQALNWFETRTEWMNDELGTSND
jgi:hypothetical protein